MTSVFFNEIVFVVAYVWPASVLTALLLERPGARRWWQWIRLALGPIGLVWMLWNPYLRLSAPDRAMEPARPGRTLRKARLHAHVLLINAIPLALLLGTGVAIFLHPGWTQPYYRTIQIHVAVGYLSFAIFVVFLGLHVYKHFSSWASCLAVVLLATVAAMVVVLNEMNPRYLYSVPVGVAAVWLVRSLRSEIGPTASPIVVDSGIALLVVLMFTYFTGILIAEPAVRAFSNNMALYLIYVHGAFVLALLPLVASLLVHHLRVSGPLAIGAIRWLSAPLLAMLVFGLVYRAIPKWSSQPLEAGGRRHAVVATDAGFPSAAPERAFSPSALAHQQEWRSCGDPSCHPVITEQWGQSAHRYAGSNKYYRAAALNTLEQKGRGYLRWCQNCHDPSAALMADRAYAESTARIEANPGVSCVNCHTFVSVAQPAGNGRYTLREAANLPLGEGAADMGDARRSLTLLDLRLHLVNYSNTELFESPDFCMACHRLSVPPLGDLDLSNPLSSWKSSPEAQAGIACRDCHMAKSAPDHGSFPVPDHRFPGLGFSLGRIVDARGIDATRLRELERFTTEWQQGSAERSPIPRGPLLDVQIDALESEAQGPLRVRVTTANLHAGHDFPGGTPDTRQVWLALEVRGEDGALLFSSGDLDQTGRLAKDAHRLGGRLVDESGRAVSHHEIWRVARIEDARTISPAGSTEDLFEVSLPDTASGLVSVRAEWRFRRGDAEFANFALGDTWRDLEVIVLASAARSISLR